MYDKEKGRFGIWFIRRGVRWGIWSRESIWKDVLSLIRACSRFLSELVRYETITKSFTDTASELDVHDIHGQWKGHWYTNRDTWSALGRRSPRIYLYLLVWAKKIKIAVLSVKVDIHRAFAWWTYNKRVAETFNELLEILSWLYLVGDASPRLHVQHKFVGWRRNVVPQAAKEIR